ncbi:hypothetical protein OQA88_5337 [Cercophora sp. LCS_1]
MRATQILPFVAAAAADPYRQCGGVGWAGPVSCVTGYYCHFYNDWYSQCIPGTATTSSSSIRPTTTSTPSSTSSTTVSPTIILPTPTTLVTVTQPLTTTGGATPTTLENGWFWIRAVATPNYRSYLQAQPTGVPPAAIIASNTGAGQFNVVSGQLVYNRFGAGNLYMHVENPAVKTQRRLKTWFESTPNTYGTFAFQGDTLIWSVAEISRPNAAAWLVCGDGKELFVNTGAFLYDTPAGCFDHTIHSYGGSKADV